MKTDVQSIINFHQELCLEARDLIEKKGHDYNRQQQLNGDTLGNMRNATNNGITETHTQATLVRLSDKFHRLISLTKDPATSPANSSESVRDSVIDLINYATYLLVFYEEAKEANVSSEAVVESVKLSDYEKGYNIV